MTRTDHGGAIECACQRLRRVGPFAGWDDFEHFLSALEQVNVLERVPIAKKYANVGEVETWYRCRACHSVWRLVEPDPPFAGVWERVQAPDSFSDSVNGK